METIPPGKRPMHESERLATLKELQNAKTGLKQAIETFPI